MCYWTVHDLMMQLNVNLEKQLLRRGKIELLQEQGKKCIILERVKLISVELLER